MSAFADRHWISADGLRLHYRDYPGPKSRTPLICIPGLTRNARDFEPAMNLIGQKRRVIVVELRGRGESAYAKDSASYAPPTYCHDVDLLLTELSLKQFIFMGTSLGGLVAMLLASKWQRQIHGLILNDVGPEIAPRGLERIHSYVGQGRYFDTWMHAAREVAEMHAAVYPQYGLDQWLALAKRLCKLGSNGRIGFDYDMKIAEPMRQTTQPEAVDLWPTFDLLAETPTLLLRGQFSDILDRNVAAKMMRRLKKGQFATIAGVGHAPTLNEPDAQAAISQFLAGLK